CRRYRTANLELNGSSPGCHGNVRTGCYDARMPALKVLAATLLTAAALCAQSDSGHATIQGRITDPSGNMIQKAAVTVRETQTGLVRRLITDAEGHFLASALPIGVFSVEAVAPGFGTAKTTDVTVTVGETKSVNIALQVAAVSSEITVSAQAGVIDESASSNSVTLNSSSVENLPIRGRNFQEFALLAPNVMQEQDRFGMVVNGQRSSNSNVSLDGTDFNDSLQGGQRGNNDGATFFFPQSAVREFQLVRSGATAEVGRTNSGFVNVVTKSGTNDLHGEGFYANRNGSMTSPDAFNNPSNANSQHQFGGAVGGPIRRDKLFFFATAEKNMVQIPFTVKFTPQA